MKSSFRREASIRTTLGGWPIVLTAIFQAQTGWSMDLVNGLRPVAFSMAFADRGDPLASSSRSSLMCLGAAIWTRGMAGWITKPSQVLISAR